MFFFQSVIERQVFHNLYFDLKIVIALAKTIEITQSLAFAII